jgi:hypothetical protein
MRARPTRVANSRRKPGTFPASGLTIVIEPASQTGMWSLSLATDDQPDRSPGPYAPLSWLLDSSSQAPTLITDPLITDY